MDIHTAQRSKMRYFLATNSRKLKWYVFDPSDIQPGKFDLVSELDLSVVPAAHGKEMAKSWAKALGLSTWQYVMMKS